MTPVNVYDKTACMQAGERGAKTSLELIVWRARPDDLANGKGHQRTYPNGRG